MLTTKPLHHIFYQHADVDKPWAIELSANLTREGIFQDLELAIYCESVHGNVRTYCSDRDYTLVGASRWAFGRLVLLVYKNIDDMNVKASDYDFFYSELNTIYDRIMFSES